jgi:hypothetical protein
MKWHLPPKKERAVRSALTTTEVTKAYHLLYLLQAAFGFVLWFIERPKAKLQGRIENKGDDQ